MSLTDVTQRLDAEQFRAAVMDAIVDGFYVLDGEGRLRCMNRPAEQLLGWSEEELRGRSMHSAIHFQRPDGTLHPEKECELLKVRTEGRSVRKDNEAFTRKDGTIISIGYSAAPLRKGSEIDGVVVVFRDRGAD
jgi:PAS domain S-box-containing protein